MLFTCSYCYRLFFLFFFNDPATTEIYTLSLHDALPICRENLKGSAIARTKTGYRCATQNPARRLRSEEHTSELQSRFDLVCRLLLEKKKIPTSSATAPPPTAISIPIAVRSHDLISFDCT